MENLSKWLYYLATGISVLIALFYFFNFFYNLFDPYKKTSEALIFLVGSVIMISGIFISYRYGYLSELFWVAIGMLIGTIIISIIWIFIGLLFLLTRNPHQKFITKKSGFIFVLVLIFSSSMQLWLHLREKNSEPHNYITIFSLMTKSDADSGLCGPIHWQ
jgi:uncharacterized oligopeptide transporter (OPT) family protein